MNIGRKEPGERSPYQELYNSLFHYHSPVNLFGSDLRKIKGTFTTPGHCHLRVLQHEKQAVVVAREVATNQGQSVTNAIDLIATLAIGQFGLEPVLTTFIEHYSPESYQDMSGEETFDLVEFAWENHAARNPQWRRLNSEEVGKLGLLKL